MIPSEDVPTDPPTPPRPSAFRRAILRGLGVVLPPLLTVVVLIWAWNAIESYILRPMETGVRYVVVLAISDTWKVDPDNLQARRINGYLPLTNGELKLDRSAAPIDLTADNLVEGFEFKGRRYVPDPTRRKFLPQYVVAFVDNNLDRVGPYQSAPATANAYWHRYVELRYLPRSFVLPLFLVLFLAVLYFLGKVFAHGIGRWFVNSIEAGIDRIPLVNKVYGSVKQVTDFAFSEREIEFNRVVAIEYPREGIWSIGFVTGNGIPGVAKAAGEPVLSVLMPTSPMPMTGFTVTVRRSEAIDLDLTIDEAIQFCISCGVVVPTPKALPKSVANGVAPLLTGSSKLGTIEVRR